MTPVRGGEQPPVVRRLPIDMDYVAGRAGPPAAHAEPDRAHRRGRAVRRRAAPRPRHGPRPSPGGALLNATLPGRRTPARPGDRRARRHDRLHGHPAQGQRPARGRPSSARTAPASPRAPTSRSSPTTRAHLHRHGPAAQGQRPPVRRRGRHPGRRLAAGRGAGRRAGRRRRRRCRRSASRSATSSRSTPTRRSPRPATSRAATSTTRPASPPRSAPSRRSSTRRSTPLVSAHLLVTIAEEVGHGATHGLDTDVAEMVAVDNAVVAPGQQSREDVRQHRDARLDRAVRLPLQPAPHRAVRRARHPAPPRHLPLLPLRRRQRASRPGSRCAPRWSASASTPRHGHERTHLDGIQHVAELLSLYLQTDLTFPDWDTTERGPLEEFPSRSVQPTPLEDRRRATDRPEDEPRPDETVRRTSRGPGRRPGRGR